LPFIALAATSKSRRNLTSGISFAAAGVVGIVQVDTFAAEASCRFGTERITASNAMNEASAENTQSQAMRPIVHASLAGLGLSALGIVFGDIGTSPLYTLKTVLALTGAAPTPDVVLGVLSLILWTLVIITSIKYVVFAMSIDNDGEGGILALMSLLGVKKHQRPAIVAVGLFRAALIYGDGAITPAISVLSALEGLDIATPAFQPHVLPAATAILLALFAIQPQAPLGSARPSAQS
jgi:KUP system potassium uptake protein